MQTDFTYSDKELALLLEDRDNTAFSWLYDHYSGALYGFIFEILSNTESASEVLQKVYINVWKNIRQYDATKESLFTWMMKMAHGMAVDLVRSARSSSTKPVAEPGEDTGRESKATSFAKILHILNPEDRAIFDLIYFKGYKAEEIAVMKSISTGAVQNSLHKVLLRLRELLK